MSHCLSITETLCSSAMPKTNAEFAKYLSMAMEMFFTLLDDQEADVRLMADENLNRAIKSLCESNVGRLQVELYKEIKKNGSTRCLKAALVKFSDLAPLIRPQKCRPYVVNLLPCLIKVARRKEETIHETLADTIPRLFGVIGKFVNDNEMKLLLKSILVNLFDESSPAIRRNTAITLTAVCIQSRKPHLFLPWLLSTLMDVVLPVQNSQPHKLIGVLLTSRQIVQHLVNCEAQLQDVEAVNERLLQLYEMTLHLLDHADKSVVTHALEALQQLLKTPTTSFKQILLSPAGIRTSKIYNDRAKCSEEDGLALTSNRASSVDLNPIEEEAVLEPDKISELSASLSKGTVEIIDSEETGTKEDREESKSLKSEPLGPNNDEETASKTPEEVDIQTNIGGFCDQDIALIYCARRLVSQLLLSVVKGELLSDRVSRVSLKALAFGCLTNSVAISPKIFLLSLFVDETKEFKEIEEDEKVLIRDVANFTRHEDPQLRGAVVTLLGQVLRGALVESGGQLDLWYNGRRPDHVDTVNIFNGMLDEETSAITIRHLLASTKGFIRLLLESVSNRLVIPLVNAILSLSESEKGTKYWLVKIELCKVIEQISFLALKHLTVKPSLQRQLFEGIVLRYLVDEDARVRTAAAETVANSVPNLYFAVDDTTCDTATTAAVKMSSQMLLPILGDDFRKPTFQLYQNKQQHKNGFTVAPVVFRLVNQLYQMMLKSPTNQTIAGCFEALTKLVKAFPPTEIPAAWGCHVPKAAKTGVGKKDTLMSGDVKTFSTPAFEILKYCCDVLRSSTSVATDIPTHASIVSFASSLLSGLSMELLKTTLPSISEATEASVISAAISHEERLNEVSKNLLLHCYKMLAILCHVIDEVPCPPSPVATSKVSGSSSSSHSGLPPVKNSLQSTDKSEGSDKVEKFGSFSSEHHYRKIFDVISSLHDIYSRTCYVLPPMSTDPISNSKIQLIVRECLDCISSVLEFSINPNISKHTEELLGYLKTLMTVDPLASLSTVQCLLRCIFKTNSANTQVTTRQTMSSAGIMFHQSGLFYSCFDKPYNELVHTFHLARDSTSTPDRSESSLFDANTLFSKSAKRSFNRKQLTDRKPNERQMLSNYIRLFEPMVIKSLKHYTMTSDVEQQSKVLNLLVQLVKLRVNYCLLDSEKIFIGFILKQLELIEEGQISNADALIPSIFEFLVLLSYEKHHSKPIIDMPKILQLCEGLFASGQAEHEYVVPAILPVAEDLFCKRQSSSKTSAESNSVSEIEAQREVMFTMLLKTLHCPAVIEVVVGILQHSKTEGGVGDKWRRMSRTLVEAIIPLLAAGKVQLDDKKTLDLLHRFFAALAPGTLRPVDPLLIALLNSDVDLTSLQDVQRWLGFIVVSLPILSNQSPEEGILGRLEGLGIRMTVSMDGSSSSLLDTSLDSSTSLSSDGDIPAFRPEMTMAKFIIQVIGTACTKFHQLVFSQWIEATTSFLQQELSHLLLFVIYMFQSGRYYKVTKASEDIAKKPSSEVDMLYSLDFITELFVQLAHVSPFLTLQWCYILKLMKHCKQTLWSKLLAQINSSQNSTDNFYVSTCLNGEVLRKGGLVLLCDHLCDNISSAVDNITWLVMNYVQDIVCNIRENPVQDFVMSVHASASVSGLLLQAVITKISGLSANQTDVTFLKDSLTCIENVHPSHNGKLIMFLIRKYLISPHLSLTRQANSLICGRIEALLNAGNAISQLSKDEVAEIIETLRRKKLVKRFGRLVTLVNKLAMTSEYDISPLEGSDDFYGRSFFNPGSISTIVLDRDWLLGQTRVRCCQPSHRHHSNGNSVVCAKMLAAISDYNEILGIMNLKDFNLSILKECLDLIKTEEGNGPKVLMTAAKHVLLQNLDAIVSSLPSNVSVYRSDSWTLGDEEYSRVLDSLFQSEVFRKTLENLIEAFDSYVSHDIIKGVKLTKTLGDEPKVLARFTLLSLEFSKWNLSNQQSNSYEELTSVEGTICTAIHSAGIAIGHSEIAPEITDDLAPMFCIAAVDIMDNRFPSPPSTVETCLRFRELIDEGRETVNLFACVKLNELFTSLLINKRSLPKPWQKSLTNLIVSLSRLPIYSTYISIPVEIWDLKWRIDPVSDDQPTKFPYIPVTMLQDIEILCQYITRIHVLGWSSRQQFEETWMSLLGVLSVPSADLSDDEVQALSNCSAKVVQAITSLLLQTMRLPTIGNTAFSKPIHHPRDFPSPFIMSRKGEQLTSIQNSICKRMEKHNDRKMYLPMYGTLNPEKCHEMETNFDHQKPFVCQGLGQVSVAYLLQGINAEEQHQASTRSRKPSGVPLSFIQRNEALHKMGIDLRSCLQFLLDLYSQWLVSPSESGIAPPLNLMTETVMSALQISDLFIDDSQFRWMLAKFLDIQKSHPIEDEIMCSLLRLGICKAVAVLGECDHERLKKSIEIGLKSSSLGSQTLTLHGLMYLLQTENASLLKDVVNVFIPLSIDYLQTSLKHFTANGQCELHQGSMWAMAFYIIEHFHDTENDVVSTSWATGIVHLALKFAGESGSNLPSHGLYLTLMSCLERLSLKGGTLLRLQDGALFNSIVKLCTDLLTETNPVVVVPAVQLFLASMYINATMYSAEGRTYAIDSSSSDEAISPTESSGMGDPDRLMQTMEQLSILFDCVRRSDAQEAMLLCCDVLPKVLAELVPAADVINRVINEFISPGKPHQVLLAGVLSAIFKQAVAQDQITMLQEWVLMALPNFVNRSPISHSVWCLTVFFISAAANNTWLQAMFPHLQQRFGLYQSEDKKLFCLAAKHFYQELESDSQRENFVETFKSAAQHHTPYYDLLKSLN